MIRKRYIACLFALGLTSSMMAQNLEQAKKLFLEGEFEKAKPVFQSLVKKAPSNANYNYWYGACCYETGEKVEAQPYLEKSAARKVMHSNIWESYIMICTASKMQWTTTSNTSNGWKRKNDQPKQLNPN